MEAIRTLTTVKNHHILIDVPPSFENLEVEVIIFPVNGGIQNKLKNKQAFLQFLRNGPTLSPEEIAQIEAVKQEFQQWTLPEY